MVRIGTFVIPVYFLLGISTIFIWYYFLVSVGFDRFEIFELVSCLFKLKISLFKYWLSKRAVERLSGKAPLISDQRL